MSESLPFLHLFNPAILHSVEWLPLPPSWSPSLNFCLLLAPSSQSSQSGPAKKSTLSSSRGSHCSYSHRHLCWCTWPLPSLCSVLTVLARLSTFVPQTCQVLPVLCTGPPVCLALSPQFFSRKILPAHLGAVKCLLLRMAFPGHPLCGSFLPIVSCLSPCAFPVWHFTRNPSI